MLIKEEYEEYPLGSPGVFTLKKICQWTLYYSDGSIEQLTMEKPMVIT